MPVVAGRSPAWDMPGCGRSIPEGRRRALGLAAPAGYLHAELIRIEGGKHVTPEDHPRRIAEAVNALLG